jgi:hypothetical protein
LEPIPPALAGEGAVEFKITFTAGNFTPDSEVKPCTGIEGMKAFVDYAEVIDKAVAGQIVSIELSK